jgi:mannose-6-phosphate isomerase-like protein (cupin superfamily)
MQFKTGALLLLGAMGLPAPGAAQTTPSPSATTRTVLAATKLPTVTDAPLHFKAVSVILQPGEKSSVSASTFLHFFLVSAADLGRPAETPPAAVNELYRTVQPIPGLKPGSYDLNLTRVTFPAQMPSNPPHHRSGAALYFIISGTGANTIDGKTETRGPGSLIYEPHTLVHQWGNPGSEPVIFLAFNINPEGMAAVLPDTPVKKQ